MRLSFQGHLRLNQMKQYIKFLLLNRISSTGYFSALIIDFIAFKHSKWLETLEWNQISLELNHNFIEIWFIDIGY